MSVYIVLLGDNSAIKIGFSDDVRTRILAIASGSPLGATLLHEFPGGRNTEAWLHAKFKPHRIKGEWFHWNSDARALLATLLAIGIPNLDEPPVEQISGDAGAKMAADLNRRLDATIEVLESGNIAAGKQKARGEMEQALQIMFSASDPLAETYESAFLACFPTEDRWWRDIPAKPVVAEFDKLATKIAQMKSGPVNGRQQR